MFLFFGIVAVAGSYFVQVQQLPWQAFVCAVPVGLLASAILVVNNVRDLETDRRAGKRTLAVRLGRARTRWLYAAMLAGAFVTAPLPWPLGSMTAWLLLPWLAIPLALRARSASCARAPTGPRSTARWRGRGRCSSSSACCSPPESSPAAASAREARDRAPHAGARDAAADLLRRGRRARAADRRAHRRGRRHAATAKRRRWSRTTASSVEYAKRVLESYRPALARSTDMNGAQVIDACRSIEDLPAALAADRPGAVGSRRATGGQAGRGAAERRPGDERARQRDARRRSTAPGPPSRRRARSAKASSA